MEGDVHQDEDEAMALEGAGAASTAKTLVLVKVFSMDMGTPMYVDVVLIMARDRDGGGSHYQQHADGFQGRHTGEGTDQHRDNQYQPISNARSAAEAGLHGAEKAMQQLQPDQGVSKKKRPHCFRCKTSGHTNEECKADLDCIICNKKNSHMFSKCPITEMPKPTASFFWFR